MTLYRAILIDPEHRDIKAIETNAKLSDIKALIGTEDISDFRIADHEESWDYGWVDDLGLTRNQPVHAFLFSIRKDPIAGKCLLLGVDKETRDTVDARFQLDVLRDSITWLGLIMPEVTWDHTEHGSRAIVTYSRMRVA